VGERLKKTKLHYCNVLDPRQEGREFWQFAPANGGVRLLKNQLHGPDQPLPAKAVGKDWQALFQKKLNIAWLPAGNVFLRVLQLPVCDLDELRAMVELQLEKISPLPVAQILWSVEPLPNPVDNLQTVIVVIAAREVVEEFLGRLDAGGYQADKLEVPQLHQLLTTEITGDGAWIYFIPEAEKTLCLVAWWRDGILKNLHLLHLPSSNEQRPALLVEELTNIAWAGEMDGWFVHPVRLHLVTDEETASEWVPALTQWAGEEPVIVKPYVRGELAELAAKRTVRGESQANLLPAEWGAQYRQQYVDRLWMRGLGAVLMVYLAGVALYFGALEILKFQNDRVQTEVRGLSLTYTNALQMVERIEVLQEQLDLRFAALDSLQIVSEELPDLLSLETLNLRDGKVLTVRGTAPQDQNDKIYDYNDMLRRATVDGQRVFSSVGPPRIDARGGIATWNFVCELNRSGAQ
jgi:hypothetical protein